MHDGLHRSPLVPRGLKTLKYLFQCAVGTAQCHLSNELNRFGCAAQYKRRARADTQLWINWKVRHGEVTRGARPKFHNRNYAFQSAIGAKAAPFISLCVLRGEHTFFEKPSPDMTSPP